ncbi:MAG: basic secretory protein-like protein [Patescibacteria group bacterium]|nr:basic secretory protein-like protein [Patescibacteria group bacterium]
MFPSCHKRAQRLVEYFDKHYQGVFDFLKKKVPHDKIKISFRKGSGLGVNNQKTEIEYGIDNSLEDMGCLVHEVGHIVQNYPEKNKYGDDTQKWIIEGMAQYCRYRFGKDDLGWKIECPQGKCYETDIYYCAAAFIIWLERKSPEKNFIPNLNDWIYNGERIEDFLMEVFKQDVRSLWKDYKRESPYEVIYPL